MDCLNCGLELVTPRADGLWEDGAEIPCADCGAKNHISVESDTDDDGVEHCDVYVSWWTCKHGVDDDTLCPGCEVVEQEVAGAG